MEPIAEGLWALADSWEEKGHVAEAIKCLEAICQSQMPFLPIIDVKTRLRVAALLLRHSDNVAHAKSHLERAQLLLLQLPTCFELKCRTFSLLSRCYCLLGTIPLQKQVVKKGLELLASAGRGRPILLWTCNFNLQLANAFTIEGDHETAIQVLESGLAFAEEANCPDLQLMFSISVLHVYLMQWQDADIIEEAKGRCERLWKLLSAGVNQGEAQAMQVYKGLYVYKEMLLAFYCLRSCDYNRATVHTDGLDQIMSDSHEHLLTEDQGQERFLREELYKLELQLRQGSLPRESRYQLQERFENVRFQLNELLQGRAAAGHNGLPSLSSSEAAGKLSLESLGPLGEEWLPSGAVIVLVDLLKALCMRPKGNFKDCQSRIHRGLSCVKRKLAQLGVNDGTREADLEHWAVWIIGVYLILWIQLLENRVVIDLTQTELVAAQEALVQILNCFKRFPTFLQSCESSIHMLLGHYAQSMGCFQDAARHFIEASKLTDSKATQAMSQINAALAFICLEDFSQAVDLIQPVYRNMDSYVGVREKTSVLFASGILQFKQGNIVDARTRLAAGLTLTHKQLGNHQLLAQYLTILGGMATAENDPGQAHEILKSSFTLAKALRDIPTQLGLLSELTKLWRVLGDAAKERESFGHEARKSEELSKCIQAALESESHLALLQTSCSTMRE